MIKKLIILIFLFSFVLLANYVTAACTENWYCSGWIACKNGRQTRICVDLNDCGTTASKPTLERTCEEPLVNDTETTEQVVETCFDGIENQGEQGVDCGGPCVKKCSSKLIIFLWILVPIVIAGFLAIFVLFILKGRKEAYTTVQDKKPSFFKEDVGSYIRKAKTNGLNENEVTKNLVNAGWPKKVVDAHINKQPSLPANKGGLDGFVKEAIKEGYTLDQIKQQLLQAGWAEEEVTPVITKYRKYLILSRGK